MSVKIQCTETNNWSYLFFIEIINQVSKHCSRMSYIELRLEEYKRK